MDNQLISVAIPLYNEEQTIDELWSRLQQSLDALDRPYEVVLVDDGSADRTREKLRQLAEKQERVKVVCLSRNFGHQAALTAAVDHVSGDPVILMDGDLQDRPEAIADFLVAWKKGADVAYAVRSSRQESFISRVAFKYFYKILNRMSSIKQPLDAGIFGLVSRRVLDVVRGMPEHNRYFPGLRAYAGFKQVGVPVDRDARFAGSTRVGCKGLLNLAFDALFSFSYIPIRMVTWLGLFIVSFSFVYILVILHKKFISHEAILGWTSTLSAILMMGGAQMVILGILGEYIRRIYDESKHRPQYVVAEALNLPGQ